MLLPAFGPFAPARVLDVREAAVAQVWVTLAPPAGFATEHSRAGQFCKVRVGDEEGIFAMASLPGTTPLEFLLRVGVEEGGSAADALSVAAPGLEVGISPPAGAGFALERARGLDLLFVATGVGVAPVRAALDDALSRRDTFGSLTLVHGTRGAEHLAIRDDIARWEALGVTVSLCESSWMGVGPVTGTTVQAFMERAAPDLRRSAVVAVGQPEMLDQLRALCERLGTPDARFLTNL